MSELSFVKVFEKDGCFCATLGAEHALDAALSHFLDTGRDVVVTLTQLNGDVYCVRASNIDSWRISTPEGRRKDVELEALNREEHKQYRADYGLAWLDDESTY